MSSHYLKYIGELTPANASYPIVNPDFSPREYWLEHYADFLPIEEFLLEFRVCYKCGKYINPDNQEECQ